MEIRFVFQESEIEKMKMLLASAELNLLDVQGSTFHVPPTIPSALNQIRKVMDILEGNK